MIEIDRGGGAHLHEQIEQEIREGVRAGRLRVGERLPSSRSLASELRVSRGVVTEAYAQLAAEGYLEIRQGAPVRIARGVRARSAEEPAEPAREPRRAYELDPCLPDLYEVAQGRWAGSLRAGLREQSLEALGYPDPRGILQVRRELASYLGRVRGAAVDAERILICTGFAQALSLICRWLAAQGIERIGVEEPGWHPQRPVAERAGLEVVPVPVDAGGIEVDALRAAEVAAVIATTSHQFPTGGVMDRSRRTALVEWAEDQEALVIEDDYDGELSHDNAGVGALQGLAPERVIHAGSLSKRLAPGLRLGWAVLPTWLVWPLAEAKAAEDGGSEVQGQFALAHYISSGGLDRHLRRMRARYRDRRRTLLEALEQWLPEARQFGGGIEGGAGLFETVSLPEAVTETELVERAAERGVGLHGLATHRFDPAGPPGLVLGFAGLPEPAIRRAMELLAVAVDESA